MLSSFFKGVGQDKHSIGQIKLLFRYNIQDKLKAKLFAKSASLLKPKKQLKQEAGLLRSAPTFL